MSFSSTGSIATVGGIPEVIPDVPVSAVFLVIYTAYAAMNLTLFIKNQRRKHKFLFTWALFVFCMIRIVTCSLRMSWAYNQTNKNLTLVAQIFNNAGILIVYVVNFFFAWRILCAKQPTLGWNPLVAGFLKAFIFCIFGALVMVITAVVLTFTSTNPSTIKSCGAVLKAAMTYILVMTVMPALMLSISLLLKSAKEENFGKRGSMTSKITILTISVCLCLVISGFKAGTSWSPPRMAWDPAWYDSKAAFYCFSWVLEVIVLTIFLAVRVDQRFWIPNGSKGPGDLSAITVDEEKPNHNTEAIHS